MDDYAADTDNEVISNLVFGLWFVDNQAD